jgi:hypothetical protein
MDSHQKGATLKDAAKAALKPTLSAIATSINDRLEERMAKQEPENQSGSGFLSRKRELQSFDQQRNVYKKTKRRRKANGQLTAEKHQNLNF